MIDYPNLNCGQCYKLYEADGLTPCCKTSEGCPIGEELAANIDVNNYLNQFVRAKALHELNGINSLIERAYQELEILDYPNELLELEQFYLKLKNKSARKSQQWNRII
jgi:hypothetical protein